MDILVAAENLRRLQARIDARLNDARVDRDQVEKRYDMGGRHFAHLSLPEIKQRYRELIRNMAYLLDDVRDLAPAQHRGCFKLQKGPLQGWVQCSGDLLRAAQH